MTNQFKPAEKPEFPAEVKFLEIRDKAPDGKDIAIYAMAVKLPTTQDMQVRFILSRAGFGDQADEQGWYILLMDVFAGRGTFSSDEFRHEGATARTINTAHAYLYDHWADVTSGQVIDVQYLIGKRKAPVESGYKTLGLAREKAPSAA